jgi:hypothetical protein
MDESGCSASGIEQLVEKWRTEFRRPENKDHYTEIDYQEAERKYVKYRLNGR